MHVTAWGYAVANKFLVGNFWMTAIGLSDGWSGIDRASAAANFRVIHPK
jgi:hypothetical protein